MNYLIGVEREGLRIRLDGKLAETPHPAEFGDRLENPLIGTDFGEAMLELRTHPRESAASCYGELLAVTRRALALLYSKGELIWPYSLPCKLPEEAHFHYNSYPGRPDMEEHERRLTRIYGLRRSCISGIHVSFSIDDNTLSKIRSLYPAVPADKDEAYLKCARQVLRHETRCGIFSTRLPLILIAILSMKTHGETARKDSATKTRKSSITAIRTHTSSRCSGWHHTNGCRLSA